MGLADRHVHQRARHGRNVWQIDFYYTTGDGRRVRFQREAAIQTRAAATSEAEERYLLAYREGDPRLPRERAAAAAAAVKPAVPTLKRFFETTFRDVFLPRFSPATRERYEGMTRQGLMDILGDVPLDQIDAMADRRFDTWLCAKKLQARGPRGFLRTLMRSAFEAGAIPAQPVLAPLPAQSRKLPSAPSRADVDALVAATSGWLQVSVCLAAFAGLRSGEVRALEVRDVDLERGQISVRRALSGQVAEVVTPKNGDQRIVPIAEPLLPFLKEAVRGKLPRARLVTTAAGSTPTRQRIYNRLVATQKSHGLPAWSFHSLRHAFCSMLVRGGASIEAVRVLAGHSKLDVTVRYVHAVAADLTAAIGKLS